MSRPQVTQAKPSLYNEFTITCVTISACVLILIFIGAILGLLVWNGFAIKAMFETSNTDIKNICGKSNLWYYIGCLVLYNLCCFIYFISSFKVHFTKDNIVCMLSCLYVSVIVFSCWGSLEIFGNSCPSKLTNTLLYKLGYVILLFQYLLFSILPIIIIIYICNKITTLHSRPSSNNIRV